MTNVTSRNHRENRWHINVVNIRKVAVDLEAERRTIDVTIIAAAHDIVPRLHHHRRHHIIEVNIAGREIRMVVVADQHPLHHHHQHPLHHHHRITQNVHAAEENVTDGRDPDHEHVQNQDPILATAVQHGQTIDAQVALKADQLKP